MIYLLGFLIFTLAIIGLAFGRLAGRPGVSGGCARNAENMSGPGCMGCTVAGDRVRRDSAGGRPLDARAGSESHSGDA